jgi:peroxiredoxin
MFKMRVRDESIGGPNPYRWEDVTSDMLLKGKRVVLFSLPGAFTPTCSTYQLPGFEENYDKIRNADIDEVYCISVNDAFVMNAWAKQQKIQNVKVIPDGSGNFTRFMGMLIGKNHLGFGLRSWRYMAVIKDGVVEKWWQEPGINNNGDDDDPYDQTTPENCCAYLEHR